MQSDVETIVVAAMLLIGVLLWAYVLSQFCDMATNSSPGNTEFKQLLDGLNEYFDARDVPRSMHHRLRECPRTISCHAQLATAFVARERAAR